MKLDELRPCSLCGGELVPVFYTVKIQQHDVKLDEIKKTAGLAQFFGGGGPGLKLAQVMGPDNHVTQALGKEEEFILCNTCMIAQAQLCEEFCERIRDSDG